MSLRARLLLALVGLLAVGMALGAAGTRGAVATYLRGRLDQQVRDAHPVMEQTLLRASGYGDRGSGDSGGYDLGGRASGGGDSDDHDPRFGSAFLVGTYGALYDGSGRRLAETSPSPSPGGPSTPTRRPNVTPNLLATAQTHPDLATVPLWTVPAQGGGSRFRVLAERFDNADVLVVAVPFTEMDATLDNVTRIEIVASSVMLAALAMSAYVIIRLGLRPLIRIEQTADLIARGDLTKRVADADPRTEVGRLGLTFNAMLTRIEAAFQAREASERRLRRFVGDASHELRTPLTSIRGYAEMFHRGAANRPEDLATVMRRIEEESARMSVLVDDLLLLARLDQRPVLERQPVDVSAMVRDVVTDARAVNPNRTIEDEAPPILEVAGDEGRLRQAVGNLVRNAVVHTPPGTAISVVAAPGGAGAAGPDPAAHRGVGPAEDSRTGEVVISVIDHGDGVPEDAVPHLFERFYRADTGRSRDGGGTGLGLSIVAAVAAAHGGRVEYRPTPGGGATFQLILLPWWGDSPPDDEVTATT
ncbi:MULTISPECIES: sensor histidine kinase [Protofrankia]|uniref:histidine kinase n=1 Tax=Candidatus Protofrankia datiscae TaxID=2716812 RepID=F8AWZ5_9ACTN|nr:MULTISPECIES: HAMP domain-containing sensor histidine kinase [Protofrankia]AEH11439.1 integral membrane sensor signal transduction histidine kinase [Candidatus Protofrankia datiscae]